MNDCSARRMDRANQRRTTIAACSTWRWQMPTTCVAHPASTPSTNETAVPTLVAPLHWAATNAHARRTTPAAICRSLSGMEDRMLYGRPGRPGALAGGCAGRPVEDVEEVRAEPLVRQVDGAGLARHLVELRPALADLIHRVQGHLGDQPLGVVPRVVLTIVPVGGVRRGAQLVGSAVADRADQVLDVESVLDEVPG